MRAFQGKFFRHEKNRRSPPNKRTRHDLHPCPARSQTATVRINLLSDTQTRPTSGMREAMARAEVGDEQIGDDPTVNMLCERVADLLGKQAAVFMPSGTMCNVAATLVHCRPGDEILAHRPRTSSPAKAAPTQPSADSRSRRCRARADNSRPNFPGSPSSAHALPAAANGRQRRADGQYRRRHDLEEIRSRCDRANREISADSPPTWTARGCRTPASPSGISARDMAAGWESAWIDFSKGLGAPIGAVIAGSHDFIDDIWRWKQRLGGSMRQAGICAAACTYALDHHIDRLADDRPMLACWRGGLAGCRHRSAAARNQSGFLPS